MGIKDFINRPLKEETVKKIADYKLDLNKEVTSLKEKYRVYSNKDIDLNLIARFSRFIYGNPKHIAIVSAIQYIVFIIILYFYNPLNINSNYPVFSKLLVLIVAFIYVILFIFIQEKVDLGDDIDLIDPTEKSFLVRVIATIAFFILFVLVIKGLIWLFINTQLVEFLRLSMSFIAVIGVLGFIYILMKKKIDNTQNAPKKNFWTLFVKIIMFLPCLLVDAMEYIKYEYNLTSKPIWMLMGVEATVIGLWFIMPLLFSKISDYNGIKLLNKPVNLNKEYDIGDFKKLYDEKNLKADNDVRNIDQYYNDNLNSEIKNDKKKENEELYDTEKFNDPNMPKNKIVASIYKKLKKPVELKITYKKHPQYNDTDNKRFRYKYALSGWFYINPQPPNTRKAYTQYTNILKYGNKVNIEYNGQLGSLRVMTEVAANSSDITIKNAQVEVFETKNVIYQRWNHIVVNYDSGFIDVFLNGELVGSKSGVAPYMNFDTIVAGAYNGIEGGICNVVYYEEILKKSEIVLMYKALRDKKIPYIWRMKDDIIITKGQERKVTFVADIKKFFRVD